MGIKQPLPPRNTHSAEIVFFVKQTSCEKTNSKATEEEDEEILIALLSLVDLRMQSAAQGTAALWFVSYNGNTDKVKILLSDSRVNPAADDNTNSSTGLSNWIYPHSSPTAVGLAFIQVQMTISRFELPVIRVTPK